MSCVLCNKADGRLAGMYACSHMVCSNCTQTETCPRDNSANVSFNEHVQYCLQFIASIQERDRYYAACFYLVNYVRSSYNSATAQQCQRCANYLDADGRCIQCLFSGDLPSLSLYAGLNGNSQCPRCSSQYKSVVCPTCGFVNLAYVETLKVKKISTEQYTDPGPSTSNPCWTCPNCSYEYNMQAACTICRAPYNTPALQQAYSFTVVQTPQAASLPVRDGAQGTGQWTCQSCWNSNPNYVAKCRSCSQFYEQPAVPYATSKLQSSLPAQFPTGPQAWTCLHCNYTYNQMSFQGCGRCQAPRQ